MKLLFSALVLSALALVPNAALAQFGGKPYQQWSAREAETLVTNSPWAQTQVGLVSTRTVIISFDLGFLTGRSGR